MGRRRTRVGKVREIIRYGCTTELSERQIARALGVSRTVVAKTLRAFRHSGLDCAAAATMADSELQKSLDSPRAPAADSRYAVLAERFPAGRLDCTPENCPDQSVSAKVSRAAWARLLAKVRGGRLEVQPLRFPDEGARRHH